MNVRRSDLDGYSIIRLGGETAVVVPLDDYRLLAALRARASSGDLDEALFDAAIAQDEERKAAGRNEETIPHDQAMAQLLTEDLPVPE